MNRLNQMANENNRNPDPRRRTMERTRVRTILAGRNEQKQKKQQNRLAKQEQKMAEKIERQKQSKSHAQTKPPAKNTKTAGASFKLPAFSAKKTAKKVKGGFQVITGGRYKKWSRLVAVVAIVLAFIVVINATVPISIGEYFQNVFAGFGAGGGFPVAISTSDRNRIASSGSDIALLEDSSFRLFKSGGKLIAERQHGFINPAIATSSSRVLLYDRGNKSVRVGNRAKTLFSFDANGPITTAYLARNGYFALVTRGVDSVSDVTVYNAKGKEKFVWHSRSRQVIDAALSDNGKYLAVATLHVEAGQSVTGITLFNTRKGTTLAEETALGSIPVSLDMKGSYALAILNDMAISLSKSGKRTDYPYDGGTLTCFDNQNNSYGVLVLAMYQDTRSCRVVTLNKKGSVIGQSDLPHEAYAVSAKNNSITLLSEQSVLFCNKKGSLRKKVKLTSDATTLLCKGNRAILLGSERLEEIHK
ncbi:MAG: hypothetical protein IKU10_03260 [Clostridia bacterium]|nr:hypothetical protein [Clostridia bacterium]